MGSPITQYDDDLREFLRLLDASWHVDKRRPCMSRLADPMHRCKGACSHYRADDPYAGGRVAAWGGGRVTWASLEWNFDHLVFLRRHEARPRCAVLSQPYAEPGSEFDVGLAPYGHGTRALLYVGRPVRDDSLPLRVPQDRERPASKPMLRPAWA